MERYEKVELTNMCMIYDDLGNILVQNRVKSWCGIAFPGGHVIKNESIVDSVVREIFEETGLHIDNLKLCGVKQWFKNDVRNVCFLFKTNSYSGNLTSNDEGENMWVKRSELNNYKLASNFSLMLQVFESECINEHYHSGMYDDKLDIFK